MVYFKVRADSLSEVAALISNVLVTFDGNVAAVNSTVASLAGSTWVGEDAESFLENWTSFMTMSAQVRLSLTALQGGLVAADGSYTQTESGIRGAFTGRTGSVAAIRATQGGLAGKVARGEDQAEDMAEFFGRDYAGDSETENFGGGVLGSRGSTGQTSRGASGDADTDNDGDSDGIGQGPYLSPESVAELQGDGGDGGEGVEAMPATGNNGAGAGTAGGAAPVGPTIDKAEIDG